MDDSTPRILNIDDYLPSRYARTKVLRQAGFTVIEASNGVEALRAVAEHKPVVVLLDVNLPDMSGFEVCGKIRENPETAATIIIHVSASSVETRHMVTGLESGADGYLVEPLDSAVLIATVNAFIRARRAEDALRRSNAELESFAYRAAHDLNEPLRAIFTHTQIIELHLKEMPAGEANDSLKYVLEGANRMRTLIDALLQFAQASSTEMPTAPIDTEAVLSRVLVDLEATIRESKATLTYDKLPTITAAPNIAQVFQNLISNAIKYRRQDVAPQIHISARADRSLWIFSVKDNGIGVDPSNHSKIFNNFTRLHGREIPGTGLGLAVCMKVVKS